MRLRHTFAALALTASLFASSAAFAADNYKIDSQHGTVIFRIAHFEIGNAYGRFNEPTGTVVYDKADPSRTSFNIEIQTDKIDTANAKRDAHLKSPDFFNAKQFPTITFKSTSVKEAGEGRLEVTGDLNLHGVTKTITIPVKKAGEKDTGKMGYRTGWEAEFDIKRSDFGMTGMMGPIGDDVHLIVSFEAVRS